MNQISQPRSIIPQPLARPPRPQVLRPRARVQARLIHAQYAHLDTHARTGVILRPDIQADGVIAVVVEDTREDGEFDLVTDVWDEFAELVRGRQISTISRSGGLRRGENKSVDLPYIRSRRAAPSLSTPQAH